MEFRRGMASVMTALVLLGGGASLAACADPAGRNVKTGTPMDTSMNTSGNDPSGKSQGYLPDNTDKKTNNPERGNQNGKGTP